MNGDIYQAINEQNIQPGYLQPDAATDLGVLRPRVDADVQMQDAIGMERSDRCCPPSPGTPTTGQPNPLLSPRNPSTGLKPRYNMLHPRPTQGYIAEHTGNKPCNPQGNLPSNQRVKLGLTGGGDLPIPRFNRQNPMGSNPIARPGSRPCSCNSPAASYDTDGEEGRGSPTGEF